MNERGIRAEPLAAGGGISETVRLYPHLGEYIRTRISSDVNELSYMCRTIATDLKGYFN